MFQTEEGIAPTSALNGSFWLLYLEQTIAEVGQKESVNVKIDQWKLSNLKNRQKKYWKKMNRASGSCVV